MGRELGRGQFGITRQCIERKTGTVHACKLIAKSRLQPNDYILREVQIMHHLVGHPHVVKIQGAYEDPRRVYIVMELCTGGELFDRIVANGRFSEKAAAAQIADIVGVVQHCHQLGVMHLDLKPENFLLASEDHDALLKVTDFGLSRFFKVGEVYTEEVGSLIYKAPEVLRCRYGPEADVWSAGVILYILLCGYPPFKGENDNATRELIKRGPLNFDVAPWPEISESAKDLVSHMLDREPRRRFTASEVLNHPWIAEEGVAADRDIDCAVLQRLKQFSATNKLQKMALKG
ncbi:Serine Threonine protein kinase [Klebsormidium nitens]|uniref:Serine Threonine protein kinase n=1 Tax=Klebsormidium nitens TaxID=105231 RepID=A0A0U9HKM1_KLENI|nr:Serine Threonine protein kinase [Klebsormidium nitens]|eukprot:GAQ89885.1 Serine Threonine protein kinase [Klebsormidium nitens]